jgi:hypothetical protein
MDEKIFAYCERGSDPGFWAEPFNAVSNVVFLIAALAGLAVLLRLPHERRSGDHWLLVCLVATIGAGSFAFHVEATRLTALADVIPISVFMLVYFGFALNRFLDAPPGWTVLATGVFAVVIALAGRVTCAEGSLSFAATGGAAEAARGCLNGSVAYLPALAAMIGIGVLMRERGHAAAKYVLAAGIVFTVSLVFRTIDRDVCEAISFDGRAVGTHFLWHGLNAVTLFLLLQASFLAGSADTERRLFLPRPTSDS